MRRSRQRLSEQHCWLLTRRAAICDTGWLQAVGRRAAGEADRASQLLRAGAEQADPAHPLPAENDAKLQAGQ